MFLGENCKNSLAAGGYAPRPPWPPAIGSFTPRPLVVVLLCQILGATPILHIVGAYYSCVDSTKMKDANKLIRLIHPSIVIIALVCESARFLVNVYFVLENRWPHLKLINA